MPINICFDKRCLLFNVLNFSIGFNIINGNKQLDFFCNWNIIYCNIVYIVKTYSRSAM